MRGFPRSWAKEIRSPCTSTSSSSRRSEPEVAKAMNLSAFRLATEHATEVTGAEYTVWLVLCYMADRRMAEAYPRTSTLARMAHLSRHHTRRCLNKLIDRGYVRVRPPRKPGYPPTLRLVTWRPYLVPEGPPLVTQEQPMEHPIPLGGTSVGTNHADIKQELVNEGVKLTRVSPSPKKRRRCAHEGCIYLTNDVHCDKHAS